MGIVVGRPSRTILLDTTGEENWNSMLATDDTPVIIRSYGLRRRRNWSIFRVIVLYNGVDARFWNGRIIGNNIFGCLTSLSYALCI